MSDFQKQINKQVAGIKLSATEKRELKSQVISYMEYHPRREQVAQAKAEAYLASQPYTILSFHNKYLQGFVGLFAVLIFIAVPSMAERAVPGDVLYPIKVKVNEEVRGTLTFSATDKIEWQTELLERRISEVRLLASEGKLTDEVEADAVVAVKAHAEAAQDGINKLRDTDADEASFAEVAFGSVLEVQSFVLDTDTVKNASSTGEVNVKTGLAMVVQEAQAAALAKKSTTTPSYIKITARLETETTRAYELFTSVRDAVSEKEKNEIERRFSDIERTIIESQLNSEELTANPAILAPQELVDVLSDIRKLISFMTDIDVRSSVDIESLVPISLTDEERLTQVMQTRATAISRLELLNEAIGLEQLSVGATEKALAAITIIEAEIEKIPDPTQIIENTDITDDVLIPYEASVKIIRGYLESVDVMLKNLLSTKPVSDIKPNDTVTEIATSSVQTTGSTTPEATSSSTVIISEEDSVEN